MLCYVIVRSKA